jgi:hypothetical protein
MIARKCSTSTVLHRDGIGAVVSIMNVCHHVALHTLEEHISIGHRSARISIGLNNGDIDARAVVAGVAQLGGFVLATGELRRCTTLVWVRNTAGDVARWILD